MNLSIKRNEKTLALVKQLASKNREEAWAARESLAAFIGDVIIQVIQTAPIMANVFTDLPFDENSNPSIPLDLFRDVEETDFIRVWSQTEPGGLPRNEVFSPQQELKFSTYPLDSAWAFDDKYARQSRLDVVAKVFERLMQEILIKQDDNSAAVILRSLANATTTIKDGTTIPHVIRSHTDGQLLLEDFVRMFTLHKRIRSAWNKGTAAGNVGRGLTDLVLSPEMVEELRKMAYNPMNTRAGVTTTSGAVGIPLTDSQREAIFNNAGIPEFYGVSIMEINELGVGYKYNDLFDAFAGATNYPDHGKALGDTASQAAFNGSNEEVLIGLDLSDNMVFVRPIETSGDEGGSSFVVRPDDQYTERSEKIGFYGKMREGRLVLDDRYLSALVV